MKQKLPTRKDIYRSLAKVFAFMSCGKLDESRQWTEILVRQLRQLGLFP